MIKLKAPHNEYHREEKYLRICLANKTNDNKEKHTLIKFLISFRNSHSYTSFKALRKFLSNIHLYNKIYINN